MPAAVPKYVGDDFAQCPPGHRYRLYFDAWLTRAVLQDRIRDKQRKIAQERRPAPRSNLERQLDKLRKQQQTVEDFAELDDELRGRCLQQLQDIPKSVREIARAVLRRRKDAAASAGDRVVILDFETAAPLVTGMGIEHPNENGFAFLDPYGLPYLPGSSVKGALRHAAEALATEEPDSHGWTLSDVWYLFGFDASADTAMLEQALKDDGAGAFAWMRDILSSQLDGRSLEDALQSLVRHRTDRQALHYRGALECWDGLIDASAMRVDIMNPHYSAYYKDESSPSDDGNPTPIRFLCVPPGARVQLAFRFSPLPGDPSPGCAERGWRALLDAVVGHAGMWTGFGAKTSVGYGRLASRRASGAPAAGRGGGISDPDEEIWSSCLVTRNPSDGALTAQSNAGKAEARRPVADELYQALPDDARMKLKKKKRIDGVTVRVRIEGNKRTILSIEVPK